MAAPAPAARAASTSSSRATKASFSRLSTAEGWPAGRPSAEATAEHSSSVRPWKRAECTSQSCCTSATGMPELMRFCSACAISCADTVAKSRTKSLRTLSKSSPLERRRTSCSRIAWRSVESAGCGTAAGVGAGVAGAAPSEADSSPAPTTSNPAASKAATILSSGTWRIWLPMLSVTTLPTLSKRPGFVISSKPSDAITSTTSGCAVTFSKTVLLKSTDLLMCVPPRRARRRPRPAACG